LFSCHKLKPLTLQLVCEAPDSATKRILEIIVKIKKLGLYSAFCWECGWPKNLIVQLTAFLFVERRNLFDFSASYAGYC